MDRRNFGRIFTAGALASNFKLASSGSLDHTGYVVLPYDAVSLNGYTYPKEVVEGIFKNHHDRIDTLFSNTEGSMNFYGETYRLGDTIYGFTAGDISLGNTSVSNMVCYGQNMRLDSRGLVVDPVFVGPLKKVNQILLERGLIAIRPSGLGVISSEGKVENYSIISLSVVNCGDDAIVPQK
jgi:hypothetical protein